MKLKKPFSFSSIELRWLPSSGFNGKAMSSQTGLKHVVTEPTRLETKRERRRGAAGRAAALRRAPSDSDCSGETASLSADSGDRSVRPPPPPPRSGKNRRRFSISSRRRGSEWEVLEGLKDGQRFEKRPEVFNGYLHKKRKWPLKGWHKRFFVIDGGILVYARSPADVARGRLHGSVDVGLSVLSAKARCRRVDIDADEFIYHLRAKTNDVFRTWLGVLEAHRLYRQHLLTFGARESVPKIHAPLEDLPPTDTSSHNGSPLESASRELGQAQLSVQQLQRLLAALELQQQQHHDTDVSLEGASPNVKKDRRKFGLRKKKSSNKCASGDLQPGDTHGGLSSLTAPPSPGAGASPAPALAASLPLAAATRPASLPGADTPAVPSALSLTPDHQLREDFTVLAKDLVCSLKGVVATLARERSRARVEGEAPPLMAALRSDLSTALHLNSELRARLARIHDASDLADVSCAHASRQFQQSLSYSSSCVSASEFFDAEEHESDKDHEIINADKNALCPQTGVIELDGDSSSEAGSLSSEEGSASSDNSDANMVTVVAEPRAPAWVRRGRLPAPRPEPGGPSLWNLLYKNIGKDLSQISMPVTINEPLNMLQRLCEELEYSELLDAAAGCSDAGERAALVASFAVSAYAAAAHRAASKPFNPLLGETYECVRDDRGFSFLAEQVSHHPPISACHASSPRWVFWQEARIKTKFWGKSMEFQPAGRVHVRLATTGDHYSWNKVTTCVHNLFGGQRWVDQYGDMHIVCHGTDVSCKLNFIKASSWSSSRHEVRGAVSWGSRRLRLSGRWSEAVHAGEPPGARCLWRPGAMPADHEAYYGFTRFATELNELEPGMTEVLPHTDTRLRPDQRALEEGDVEAAERLKHQLEQAQRERRRDSPEHTPAWFRKESDGGEEVWRFTGAYWSAREAGFPSLAAPRLW